VLGRRRRNTPELDEDGYLRDWPTARDEKSDDKGEPDEAEWRRRWRAWIAEHPEDDA
jgi:hypothetical protein